MFGSTMLMTVGAALDRALQHDAAVRIRVSGEWISGRVLATDGQSAVVAEESGDTCVVRVDQVAAVRFPRDGRPVPMVPSQGGAERRPAAE